MQPPPDTTPADAVATPPGDHPAARQSVWKHQSSVAWLLAVTAVALAADLLSKWLAFKYIAPSPVRLDREAVLAAQGELGRLIPQHDPVVVAPSLLELTLVLNPGAVFGIGAGRRWFFVVFTIIAIGFALWIFGAWTRAKDRMAHAAIGLLLAGGLGNLYDRLIHACVRDFLHPLPGVRWPGGKNPFGTGPDLWPYVSNVADLWLIVGMGILVIHLWRGDRHDARQDPKAPKADRPKGA